jgi:hypothetical protein
MKKVRKKLLQQRINKKRTPPSPTRACGACGRGWGDLSIFSIQVENRYFIIDNLSYLVMKGILIELKKN